MNKNDFDQLFDRFDALTVGFGPMLRKVQFEDASYPPYDIINISDTQIRLVVALAGFKKNEISVEELDGKLTIRNIVKQPDIDPQTMQPVVYQHKGISKRKFARQFTFSQDYKPVSALFEDGTLIIDFMKVAIPKSKAKILEIK